MKKFLIIIFLAAGVSICKAQTNPFPSTDSLERFINRYVRNSAVEAFQNLRLNTVLIGMLRYIQNSEIGSGVDTMYLSGCTLTLTTGGGDTLDISLCGKLDSVTIETATSPNPDTLFEWRGSTRTQVGFIPKVTASNGLTKTGNNITLGGLLTGSTFIEGEQNLFAITNTSQSFILSENPGNPADYAQLFLSYSGDARLRNNLSSSKRSDFILGKQKILLSVDYDILSYINSIVMDTTFTWLNSRVAVFNQRHGDMSITDPMLNKAFNVFGSAYIRDTLHITNFPVGNSTDSVMVWRASDSTVRKVAQSSISGGGGGGTGFGIDSTVISGTAGSVLFVGTGPVLAQDNANFFWDNSNKRLGIGTASPDRLLHAEASDAITNAITFAKRISHISSGTVATNFGIGEEIELENASGTNKVVATQTYAYSDAVNATEDVTWTLDLIRAGTVTNALTVLSSGALSAASSVTSNGNFTAGAANSLRWSGRSAITSSADGIINLFNNAQNNFTLLTFGGTSSSFPALLRSSTNLVVRLADNSANTDLEVLDEAYNESTWNGSNEVPTKNATRDKIEGMNIVQGTYTPTLTNGSNVDASTVPGTTLYYQRQGNQVTVWGMVTIDPNAATTTTVLSISLPIASALTSYTQLSGQATGNFVAGAYFGGFIQGDDTNDRAQLDFTSGTSLNQTWSIRFTYEIL